MNRGDECLENVVTSDKLENTFISIVIQCMDNIFDWLSLRDLAALNLTCKHLQQLTADYFHRKYQMKTMKVGQSYGTNDMHFRCYDKFMQMFKENVRNLVVLPSTECLQYLQSNHNKDIVSLAFYDGEILDDATAALAELVERVEIIEFQYGAFSGEFYECALKHCKQMKQLVIKNGFSECENWGIENQWLLKKYPTLEHFHWSAGPLPEHLETFFHRNPNVRSFDGSIYPTMSTIQFLLDTSIKIEELHLKLILELHEVEFEGIAIVRENLNRLYERKQIQRLMLQFVFCNQLCDPQWQQMEYLNGVYCDFSHRPNSTKALSELIHLKMLILGINTVVSRSKASFLAKHLINLEEIYIQIDIIHAIIPFLRLSPKLYRIYVYKMGLNHGFNGNIKKNHLSMINKERTKLNGACKTTVYLPDEAYVQIKCKSNVLNYSLIEVKRSDSFVVKHPFAMTMLRRDICELYEKF